MKNRYTAITRQQEKTVEKGIKRKKFDIPSDEPKKKEFLDPGVWAPLNEVPEIHELWKVHKVDVIRNADGKIISIDLPTDILKRAIKSNAAVREGLTKYFTELRDLATPSFIISGFVRGIKISKPVEGGVYVQMTLRDEKTAIFPHHKKPAGVGGHVRWLARYVPAFFVAGGISGTGYLGYRVMKAGVEVVTPAAERNHKALESPEGLDDVVHELAGQKPKSYTDQQKQREDNKKISRLTSGDYMNCAL